MIIAFDGSRAFTTNRTGTENYSYQLLKNLAKIDQKNTYKVFLRPNSVIPVYELESMQKDSGSQIKSGMTNYGWPDNFHFITIRMPYLWTQVGLAIRTFFDPMDVLFVPAHTLPLIRAPWVKTVVTVHDLGSEYLPQAHQLKQRLYLSIMQNYQLQTATKLIAVSNATKEDLINKFESSSFKQSFQALLIKKIGLDAKNIEVIYEGFNESLFKPLKSDALVNILKQYDLEKEGYFLFVGTVQPRKNLERLIRAFQGITGSTSTTGITNKSRGTSKLVIVGKKGWLSDEIYKLPKKLGIEEQVKFLDYVKDADLPALYNGAIAFVYPSLFEGFGLPILEAQACQTPVITSNLSSMPEVLGGAGILVDPYSTDQITYAMIKVQSKGVRARLVKKGLENVKKFSWERSAKQTLNLLETA